MKVFHEADVLIGSFPETIGNMRSWTNSNTKHRTKTIGKSGFVQAVRRAKWTPSWRENWDLLIKAMIPAFPVMFAKELEIWSLKREVTWLEFDLPDVHNNNAPGFQISFKTRWTAIVSDKTMSDHIEKRCPKCGQQLRIPKNIGGVLMVCPSCGKKIHSDFKLSGLTRKGPRRNILKDFFEMPYNILCIIRDFLLRKWTHRCRFLTLVSFIISSVDDFSSWHSILCTT